MMEITPIRIFRGVPNIDELKVPKTIRARKRSPIKIAASDSNSNQRRGNNPIGIRFLLTIYKYLGMEAIKKRKRIKRMYEKVVPKQSSEQFQHKVIKPHD
jgi:hypothetical protein